MKDFLFFAAIYGFAISLTVLAIGSPVRAALTWLDSKIFPWKWKPFISEELRGGPLRLLINCPACVSFWTALFVSWKIYSPALTHAGAGVPFTLLLGVDAFASVGIIWIVQVVMTKLGQYE